ncbi:protocatechuate 3,4-dioxygenase subunit alpha [soil metagenome]
MAARLDYLKETPSQTAGPYVHIGLAPRAAGFDIFETVLGAAPGEGRAGGRITIEGRVLDGTGAPVTDALIETWQADGEGAFAHGAAGWGRIVPDFETGIFRIETVKPGRSRSQAPHIALWLVARGINIGLQTRIYFPADDHAGDPVLGRIAAAERRATLIAEPAGPGRYRFDIRLRGERETVFLDI